MGEEDVFGDGQAEYGVTEELEPLVRQGARVLRAPRAVREGALEEARVAEGVSQTLGQGGGAVGGDQLSSRPQT